MRWLLLQKLVDASEDLRLMGEAVESPVFYHAVHIVMEGIDVYPIHLVEVEN